MKRRLVGLFLSWAVGTILVSIPISLSASRGVPWGAAMPTSLEWWLQDLLDLDFLYSLSLRFSVPLVFLIGVWGSWASRRTLPTGGGHAIVVGGFIGIAVALVSLVSIVLMSLNPLLKIKKEIHSTMFEEWCIF